MAKKHDDGFDDIVDEIQVDSHFSPAIPHQTKAPVKQQNITSRQPDTWYMLILNLVAWVGIGIGLPLGLVACVWAGMNSGPVVTWAGMLVGVLVSSCVLFGFVDVIRFCRYRA